jgi:hypothetical protein
MRRMTYIAVAALATVISAKADIVLGSGGFQAFSAPNEDNTPFWDGNSTDGGGQMSGMQNNCNVGFYMAGTAAPQCGVANFMDAPGAPEYWGNADGTAGTFYLQATNIATRPATLRLEIAGRATQNRFGWYQTDAAGNAIAGTEVELFSGASTAVTTVQFTPSAYFGYYFQDFAGNYHRSGAGGEQRLVLFKEDPLVGGTDARKYWIGVEDTNLRTGDRDYNDMIIRVVAVPEPSFYITVSGLLGAFLLRRRKNS